MSRGRTKPLEPLKPAQAAAADPEVHAWVAASAGTGKTQVLSARVLRLLLAELPLKTAVRLAAEITGASRNVLYDTALEWKRGDGVHD